VPVFYGFRTFFGAYSTDSVVYDVAVIAGAFLG
jgi:hypothetical protein